MFFLATAYRLCIYIPRIWEIFCVVSCLYFVRDESYINVETFVVGCIFSSAFIKCRCLYKPLTTVLMCAEAYPRTQRRRVKHELSFVFVRRWLVYNSPPQFFALPLGTSLCCLCYVNGCIFGVLYLMFISVSRKTFIARFLDSIRCFAA